MAEPIDTTQGMNIGAHISIERAEGFLSGNYNVYDTRSYSMIVVDLSDLRWLVRYAEACEGERR